VKIPGTLRKDKTLNFFLGAKYKKSKKCKIGRNLRGTFFLNDYESSSETFIFALINFSILRRLRPTWCTFRKSICPWYRWELQRSEFTGRRHLPCVTSTRKPLF